MAKNKKQETTESIYFSATYNYFGISLEEIRFINGKTDYYVNGELVDYFEFVYGADGVEKLIIEAKNFLNNVEEEE